MGDRENRSRKFLIAGLSAALVFGILVLAGGDWLPGTIIVVAALLGLAAQVQLVGKLRSAHKPRPSQNTSTH